MKRLPGVALMALATTLCAEPSPKLRVVTSFLPLYCFAINVAGGLASVDNLTAAGVTPHDYQFAASDLRKVKDADVLLLNGLGLETWKNHLLHSISPKSVIEVGGSLGEQYIRRGGITNPHIWLDPILAIQCVINIVAGLSQVDPIHAADYTANGERYVTRLRELDGDLAEGLRRFAGTTVISYHDAFPYFARRYGLKIAGVVEGVPEVSPSPRQLTALHQIVRENDVRTLLSDREASRRLIEVIRKDFSLREVCLNTLETGPLAPNAYEEGMRANLRLLQQNLR